MERDEDIRLLLAEEQTLLSRERTMHSYMQTGLAFTSVGLLIMKFLPGIFYFCIGALFIILGRRERRREREQRDEQRGGPAQKESHMRAAHGPVSDTARPAAQRPSRRPGDLNSPRAPVTSRGPLARTSAHAASTSG